MLTFNVIGISILLIIFAIEIALVIKKRPDKEMIKDVKSNFLLGLFYLVIGLSMKGLAFSVYSFFYYFSIFKPEISWWLWLLGFMGCEFCHFYYHWLGHKSRIFWASHVTHHSSEYFNISTGFRNNFLHVFYQFLFWSPLCLLGIPPEMILFFESITAIQNFIVHTEKIGKLGILDKIFNTPSNHRVHHGINPNYIDKNFGGITLLYDHLFGTYTKETEPAIYGITHNIHTHDPFEIIFHEYIRIKNELPKIKGFLAKLKYLFSAPD